MVFNNTFNNISAILREFLDNIYFTFIRPILEYTFEVWDNCRYHNSDRLAILQLEAARIATGLACYTSVDSIYRETGWKKLSTRREVNKICMFYGDRCLSLCYFFFLMLAFVLPFQDSDYPFDSFKLFFNFIIALFHHFKTIS
jgi:hypothetical protein